MTTGIFFHKEFIGKNWPVVGDRYEGFDKLIEDLSKDSEIEVIEPEPVSEELLLRIHSKDFLEEQRSSWYYYGAKLTVGGFVKACEMVWKEKLKNAVVFLVAAGHHASKSSAWGGTYLSCIGPTSLRLRELGLRRFVLIDTDAHHGDGDRDVLKEDEDAFHLCFCWRDLEEDSKLCVNVRSPEGDEWYLEKVRSMFPRIRDFKPEMIIHFLGHDTHWNDYGSLGLSENFYIELAREVKLLAEEVCDGRYVIMDGGGANREVGKYIWPRIIKVLKK
ncbi:MAG: hypothetical protein H0Z28_13450 [Archaeoglobus sp.]|nr:hypothetical protein [Archaeoglobus sp.]